MAKIKKKTSKRKSVIVKGDFFEMARKLMPKESFERAIFKGTLEVINIRLARLRELQGIRQSEVEGFTQSSVSRLEGREDIKLSTLLQYINSIGMEIEIKVREKGKKKEYSLINTAALPKAS